MVQKVNSTHLRKGDDVASDVKAELKIKGVDTEIKLDSKSRVCMTRSLSKKSLKWTAHELTVYSYDNVCYVMCNLCQQILVKAEFDDVAPGLKVTLSGAVPDPKSTKVTPISFTSLSMEIH